MARVEEQRFVWDEPAAKAFYDAHGYVIITGVLDDDERSRIRPAFDALVSDAAKGTGLSQSEFEERFPQNRDLWTKSDAYRQLLFETRQGEVARHFLGSEGARLFHDHAIAKPTRQSGTIPLP
jgi:ectoine hydroxylase-related dioxygenase (phytanoyl-CoA dioxygenase family)